MSDFRQVTEQELDILGEAYSIISSVKESSPTLYVAGEIKSGSTIFNLCQEAAAEYEIIEPEEVEKFKIEAVALVIPINDDTIHYLNGSGLMVGIDEEFAYQEKGQKEIKTANMKFGNGAREKFKFSDFIDPVLLEDEMDVVEYLQSKTNGKIEAPKAEKPETTPETSVEIPEEGTEVTEEGKKSSSLKVAEDNFEDIEFEDHSQWLSAVKKLWPQAKHNKKGEPGYVGGYGDENDEEFVIGPDMQADVVAVWVADSDFGWVVKPATSKKSDLENSRIVRILDEYGNMWDDSDTQSTMNLIQQVEEASDEHQFVSYEAGNISKWIIETKDGPEAAFRYISMKSEIDYDTVASEAIVMNKEEMLNFLNESLELTN